ncbi:unnamed protein product [Effrenium voratum]|uniref:RanBP2-type domain-containing protein n=1 Tax=Effrenium voratum TaxID=2562239 RepID=A0AA36NIT6_9DINO|nr:unnamed protein product [Effrenium voratum]
MSGLHGPPLDAAAEDEWLPQVPQQARACFSVWAHGRLKGRMCLLLALPRFVVSCCPIRRLPSQLCKLEQLWDFYIDGNRLGELPQLPPRLNGLKVSGNLLKQLPNALGGCLDMANIRAYANQLESIPDSICELPRVVEMSLQGNRLERLPAGLGALQQLQYLSLHDNNLRSLPASVSELRELRWLYLYNNRLQDLPAGLSRLPLVERLLVEANPLSEAALADLGAAGRSVRVLGLDAAQAAKVPPPPVASVGWMLPWGRLYAKLQPASQLKRRRGLAPCPATLTHQEVLVVAFAASQAEPEWLGVLSQVYSGQVSIAEAEAQISMDCLGGFSELMRRLHGEGTEKLNEKLASTAWLLGPPHLSGQNGAVLGDFDVLSLCDTGAQWYCDVAEREQLQLESKLREFVKNYRRVIFLGVSMGGFAALSNSHLANSVLVFGPQTDLTLSHLRPGFSPDDLQRHSENMRCRVREAVAAGVQFQYHVAVEEHLAYARRVPLPLSSIFIHPIEGRIARLMEKTGILWPLLVRSIAREQKLARGEKDKWPKAEDKPPSGFFAWDLDGKEEVLQLCLWGAAGKLSTCKISGQNLTLLSKSGPRANDWFCSGCLAHNVSKASSCKKCGDSGPPQGVVAKAWRKHVPEEPVPSSRASVLARIRRLPWRTLGLVLVLLWLALRRRLR